MEAAAIRPDLPDECDLVMKGGITSGIVYQGAVLALKERFRFRNVGGASAGAIAAAVTAAAQYGELANPGKGGFARMTEVTEYLKQPGAVARLFQAAPGAQPKLDTLIAFATGQRPVWQRLLRLISDALKHSGFGALIVFLGGPWIAALAYLATQERNAGLWLAVAGTPFVLLCVVLLAVVGALTWLVRGVVRTAERNGFGLCSGLRQTDVPALTEWLHERIQHCAGTTDVVTFEMLAEQRVVFETVTTNLAAGRPVRLPLESDAELMFDPADLAPLFPDDVRRHLVAVSEETVFPSLRGTPLRTFPAGKLPVLVAARVSLSFPLLLSAVPLYALEQETPGVYESLRPVQVWFTDGGASSNFPIHFFDSWFPARPTFGLDLQGHRAGEPFVHMPKSPLEPPQTRWRSFGGLGGFVGALVDAARNWRDTLQSELPGYRERVCHIRLTETEGGLNLNMPPEVVAALVARGEAAGREVLASFDWPQHRLTRYLTWSEVLQQNVRSVGEAARFPAWRRTLAAGAFDGYAYAAGRPAGWYPAAADATERLLRDASAWTFDLGLEPTPTPAMRITPRV